MVGAVPIYSLATDLLVNGKNPTDFDVDDLFKDNRKRMFERN